MMKAQTVVCLVACLALTSCLKTRAQLKEDGGDEPAVQAKATGAPNPVQEVQPQGGYAIDEIKGEITRLTGRIEELEKQKQDAAVQAAGTQGARDELKRLEQRMTELEQAQANILEALRKVQDQGTAAAAPEAAELYTKAKGQFEAKNYDGAVESLNAYLKNPKAKRLQDATFLRAESYYGLKQYKKAIVDYSKFPEKFNKSAYMPTALYKIGLSFEQLGMKDDAKGFFQELIEKFPHSSEAKRAKNKVK
jgi:tol-pal system protein YbgF